MSKPKFRTAYDGRNREISDASAIKFAQISEDGVIEDGYDGRTQQQFGRECDINTIFAKYRVTGTVRVPSRALDPVFMDVASGVSLAGNLNDMIAVTDRSRAEFSKLPSNVRKRFDNDFVKAWNFLQDPDNLAESYSLGLRQKPKEAVQPASATSPAAKPPEAPSGAS